jgi:hypothetical protein
MQVSISEHLRVVQGSVADSLSVWFPPVVADLIWMYLPTTCYQRTCQVCKTRFPAPNCGDCRPCGQHAAPLVDSDSEALICEGCGDVGCVVCMKQICPPRGYRCSRCRASCLDPDCDHYVCRDMGAHKRTCQSCLDYPFCMDCVRQCRDCGESHCNACRVRTCSICDQITCVGRVTVCQICSQPGCMDCTQDCDHCRRGIVCRRCNKQCPTCNFCLCLTCVGDIGPTVTCLGCRCHFCNRAAKEVCAGCNQLVCNVCRSKCQKCPDILCRDCEPVMVACSTCTVLCCTECNECPEAAQDANHDGELQCLDCSVRPTKRLKSA